MEVRVILVCQVQLDLINQRLQRENIKSLIKTYLLILGDYTLKSKRNRASCDNMTSSVIVVHQTNIWSYQLQEAWKAWSRSSSCRSVCQQQEKHTPFFSEEIPIAVLGGCLWLPVNGGSRWLRRWDLMTYQYSWWRPDFDHESRSDVIECLAWKERRQQ